MTLDEIKADLAAKEAEILLVQEAIKDKIRELATRVDLDYISLQWDRGRIFFHLPKSSEVRVFDGGSVVVLEGTKTHFFELGEEFFIELLGMFSCVDTHTEKAKTLLCAKKILEVLG